MLDWAFISVILTVLSLLAAIIAAYNASKANAKSQETEEQLEKIGLLATEARGDFENIFRDHLISNLLEFRNRAANVYLLISTPAYGFAVVGSDIFQEYFQALRDLNSACDLEIILFSPDAHFHYWCNVLVWANNRSEKEGFAFDFAKNIKESLDMLKYKRCDIWLTDETTVRLFAFIDKNKTSILNKAFILLVDKISIPQDQFGDNFKSRSLPIMLPQINEYIGGDNNYFDRVKRCPYTFIKGENAGLRTSAHEDNPHVRLLDMIKWDYILGRTSQTQLPDFECFKEEMGLFVNESKLSNPEQSILETVSLVSNYFNNVINSETKTNITRKQESYINFARSKFEEINIRPKSARYSVISDGNTDTLSKCWGDIGEGNKPLFCLYVLLSSGFGESAYAKARRGTIHH